MSQAVTTEMELDVLAGAGPTQSSWRMAWHRLRKKPAAMVCLGIATVYVMLAVLAYFPFSHAKVSVPVGTSYQAPAMGTPAVLFGTDVQGRSVFWRCLYGARIDMTIAVIAVTLETVIGLLLGVVAGYFGGWLDDFIMWVVAVVNTIPWIILVIALVIALKGQTVFGHELSDLWIATLALGLTGWTGLCRLIRGETLRIRDMDYIVAGRAMGLSTPRILRKYVVPNVFHLVIVNASISIVGYIQAEVILSFLGIGITSEPSWGRMIDDALLEMLRGVWWQIVPATVAIFILSLALNYLGDALRDAFDPKVSK